MPQGTIEKVKEETATLREATYLDLDELHRMGRAFHAVTGVADIIPLDEASLGRTFIQLIENPDGALIVCDRGNGLCGAVGALLHPHYMNANHITGQELFWWVDPEHRHGVGPLLFDALEDWVKASGANTFSMITLDALEPEKVAMLYRRRGYRPVERSYIRGF
jgi:GNAT superfamily N-acetyltransferase